MERISDILSGIPFMVVTVLFQLHLSGKVGTVPSLIYAFVLTGWIGMASRVRMQFYCFMNADVRSGKSFSVPQRTHVCKSASH